MGVEIKYSLLQQHFNQPWIFATDFWGILRSQISWRQSLGKSSFMRADRHAEADSHFSHSREGALNGIRSYQNCVYRFNYNGNVFAERRHSLKRSLNTIGQEGWTDVKIAPSWTAGHERMCVPLRAFLYESARDARVPLLYSVINRERSVKWIPSSHEYKSEVLSVCINCSVMYRCGDYSFALVSIVLVRSYFRVA
jgi:hypothetical protein